MSAKHTKGPWTTDEDDHDAPYQHIKIKAGKHRTVCTVWIDDAPVRDFNTEQQANARRIVACVNACEGFSIEELEGADLFKDSIESGNLINELLAALEKIVEMNVQWALDQYGDATKAENMDCVRVARAAIAKVESGAA